MSGPYVLAGRDPATYPDARFVVVHRDPIAVLGSVAHLTEVLRKPFLNNIDPAEIGAQVAAAGSRARICCWTSTGVRMLRLNGKCTCITMN